MSHSTQVLICTAAAVAGLVWVWRRWGLLATLIAAVAVSALAGAFVPSIRAIVLSGSDAASSVPDLIKHIVS